MNKGYAIFIALLLGVGICAFCFENGKRYADAQCQVQKDTNLKASIDQALKVANKFADIAQVFVAKINESHEVTKTITETQVKYVTQYIHDHPEIEPALTVPADVLSVRRCQIDRIRKAAGLPVQERSDAAVCSSFVPNY